MLKLEFADGFSSGFDDKLVHILGFVLITLMRPSCCRLTSESKLAKLLYSLHFLPCTDSIGFGIDASQILAAQPLAAGWLFFSSPIAATVDAVDCPVDAPPAADVDADVAAERAETDADACLSAAFVNGNESFAFELLVKQLPSLPSPDDTMKLAILPRGSRVLTFFRVACFLPILPEFWIAWEVYEISIDIKCLG